MLFRSMIYVAMTGAKHLLGQQAAVAHNLANVSTNGYRAAASAFRAVPVVGGMLVATLGLLAVPTVRALPLGASSLVLSGVTGALVARGTAYPGRFSVHLIPGAVTLFVCALAMAVSGLRTRGQPRVRQPQDMTSNPANPFPMPGSRAD